MLNRLLQAPQCKLYATESLAGADFPPGIAACLGDRQRFLKWRFGFLERSLVKQDTC
jgi:hypothetical protein